MLGKFFSHNENVSMPGMTFMYDFDYTQDFAIGFDPNALEAHWKELKAKEAIEGYDRPSNFCLKAFKTHNASEFNHNVFETKVYNKFAYYILVGGNIIAKIASSLSKWISNRSPVL